jgi:hypothetical protein
MEHDPFGAQDRSGFAVIRCTLVRGKGMVAITGMLPVLDWSKQDLQHLAQRLLDNEPDAVESCLVFFEAETRGYWHNRARAMMARRFKHVPLTLPQQTRLVDTILQRLATGTFTEQFKDQLRLACRLDHDRVVATARACRSSPKAYVRQYASWVIGSCPDPAPSPTSRRSTTG